MQMAMSRWAHPRKYSHMDCNFKCRLQPVSLTFSFFDFFFFFVFFIIFFFCSFLLMIQHSCSPSLTHSFTSWFYILHFMHSQFFFFFLRLHLNLLVIFYSVRFETFCAAVCLQKLICVNVGLIQDRSHKIKNKFEMRN